MPEVEVIDNKFTMPEKMVTVIATFSLISYDVDMTVTGSGSAYILSSIQSLDSLDDLTNVTDANYNDDIYVLYIDDVVGYDFGSLTAKTVGDNEVEITNISEEKILEINLILTTGLQNE